MFCEECGTEIESGASFCDVCGKKVTDTVTPKPTAKAAEKEGGAAQADAAKIRAKVEADAAIIRAKAEAEAAKIKAKAEAEAAIIRAKAEAEADAEKKLAKKEEDRKGKKLLTIVSIVSILFYIAIVIGIIAGVRSCINYFW